MNYKDGYYYLFNKITELSEHLKDIQIQAEEICISDDEEELPKE